ncbi:shikimate dehydrogenase [Sphingopyxis macrogoltabida]|uniref:Shikimate dehydrogenase (NADP(+)) n=1 Tax=Sphingopyxis macrogoltabida TaxID=33050 RepID=A0AAC9AYR6_SPHMC|nr:shikimate dehydrogenase [Sphingopyxis macrogoltabida]ALJ15944.1 shikimate dehydrogenase [Sphingopyxis macrogoltabida]AMU92184.1 shikimate dehydrogenase [Sphingopyxis macrogoltabida]
MSKPYAEVIGDPIAHSKSPLIHNFWLDVLGIPGDYRRFHVLADELPDYIAGACADADWRGCNVTIPHKVAVMDLVDDPGNIRGTIGAMNTIVRQPDGSVIGTNTDAAGFYAPLAELDLEGAPVAVVGAGGAARAVLFALARAKVGHVTILNRSPLKAMGLLATFGLKGDVVGLDAALPPVSLLVNSSSLGMTGQPPLDLDLSPLPGEAIVYDLVYSPLQTGLLKAAEARGLDSVDGLDMLIGQAALAFELFFGAPPPEGRDDELRALLVAA